MPVARTSRGRSGAPPGPIAVAGAGDEGHRDHRDDGRLDASAALPALQPFLDIGVVATIAGGVVAAITGPTGWDHGSWVAAFLVLVVGVGQISLAIGQAVCADRPPSRRRRGLQAGMLNSGSALVIVGTLTAMPGVVTIGGIVLLAALVSFRRSRAGNAVASVWLARVYTLLLTVLIVSTPVGLAMAWMRA
jgi:hypothetical protein